jgi:hypothetical protein
VASHKTNPASTQEKQWPPTAALIFHESFITLQTTDSDSQNNTKITTSEPALVGKTETIT